MKKIFYLLSIFLIFSFSSCAFLIDEDDEIQRIEKPSASVQKKETSTVYYGEKPVLNGRIDVSGAVPSELYAPKTSDGARTAIPTAPAAFSYKYKINSGSYSTLTVAADNSYSIQLSRSATPIVVTVQAFTAASATKPMLEGSVTIPSADFNDSISKDITLEPVAGGTGTVNLRVSTAVATVQRCFAFYGDTPDDFQEMDLSSGSAYFTMGEAESVPSGAYEALFMFQDANNVVVYQCREKINVFPTLETDKWLNNGTIHIDAAAESGKGALNVTQTCLDVFTRHDFYVSNSGSSQNTGTYFDPVTFPDALRFIRSINDGTLYTIYVKDNVTVSSDYSDWPKQADGTTPEDSYITINPATNLKLKIASYGNPATSYKIDANRSVASPGRVMYVGEKAEVTLENITVTGGCSKLHGAGIYINSSTLTMNAKTAITSNYFAIDGKSGAGIYCEYGTIIMNNGAEISYNGNTEHLANGGGLYLKGSDSDLTKKAVIKMEPGSKIHHNVGYSGAGLKILYGSDSYFHGAEITDNKAIYTSNDNGGGVWAAILSGNSLEITDTTLKNNTVNCGTTGGGGAIYVHLGSVVINGTTTIENNSGITGNAIRMLNSSNQHIVLSDSVKFDNTTVKQTIAYNYSSETGAPYIKLGTLTGTVADQTVYLTISPLTEGNPVLVQDSAAVNIADYADRFIVLNTDLTPSGYKIDSNGKLAEKAVIGPNGGNASSAYADVVPFGDGTGITTTGNYSISTKEELTAFATWATTTTSTNYTFVLYDNIDLEGVPFSPIGGTKAFGGTFDGNGNKIKNLKINSASGNAALFGKVGANATVKNLYVHGEVKGGGANVAGIVSEISVNTGRIDNCVSDVTVSTSSGSSVGGICGSAKGMITNCVNIGSVTGSASGINVGGICGSAELSVYNSANFGTISGFSSVGGIVGTLTSYQTIGNCYNYGVISSTQTNNRGAIEGNGTLSCTFEDLYYHANSSVSKTIAGDNYPSVGENFTDPDALRSTLNANLLNPAYSSLSLSEWNYDYKIDGVKYPVCTTFALPEKIGVNLSDLASAPSDNSVPYIMKTQSDIEKLAGWVNSGLSFVGFEFKIPEEVSDIDLSGNWTPIGTSSNPFKGTFDGNNVKISSVSISGSNYRGFFGYIDGATIKNLTIEGSLTVTGSDCGGLVGFAKGNVVIDNCDVKMAITGNNTGARLGGILGNYDGTSSTCLYIQNCINRGTVSGGSNVGGVAGYIYSYAASPSYIYNCANYGGVTGAQGSVGGIAGSVTNTVVENCLCNPAGSVSGLDSVGKICGKATANSELNYCYYLDYSADSEDYKGTTAGTTLNCNIFRVMDTKYQVYNAGNSVIGTYPADTDLCDIMNDWVNYKNTISPGYLSWKYESSQMEFTN